jgi:hypothetical protein
MISKPGGGAATIWGNIGIFSYPYLGDIGHESGHATNFQNGITDPGPSIVQGQYVQVASSDTCLVTGQVFAIDAEVIYSRLFHDRIVSKCIFVCFLVAAVPRLFLYVRLCRNKQKREAF